jgi:hypothetical protein
VSGKIGQFEVFVDNELVIGKEQVSLWKKLLGNRGIPPQDRVFDALREKI